MSESESTVWSLVKSIILPFNPSIFRSTLNGVQNDIQDTSWTELLYRLEGISLLILIPSILVLAGYPIYQTDIGLGYLKSIGLQYLIGFSILAIILIVKIFVWIVQRVNTGESVWGKVDGRSLTEMYLRGVISIMFMLMPVFVVNSLNLSFETFAIMFLLSLVLLGSAVAGISGILSSLHSIRKED